MLFLSTSVYTDKLSMKNMAQIKYLQETNKLTVFTHKRYSLNKLEKEVLPNKENDSKIQVRESKETKMSIQNNNLNILLGLKQNNT